MTTDPADKAKTYLRALTREKAARKQAEKLLEEKSRELFFANNELKDINQELEERVRQRTEELRLAHDKALAANEAKTRFLANMSHEFRTPLNAIMGMTELSQMDLPSLQEGLREEHEERLQTTQDAAHELFALLSNVLDATKMETGDLVLEESTFALRDLYADINQTWSKRFAAKGLSLKVSINSHGYTGLDALQLHADQRRIVQVIDHLLSNALKFTEQGGASLCFDFELPDTSSAQATHIGMRISLNDTGIGMSDEVRERAFALFSQEDESITRRYGGCGVGLAIASHIVSRYEGTLDVDSEPGKGSTFHVSLQLPLSEEDSIHDADIMNHVTVPVGPFSDCAAQQPSAEHALICDSSSVHALVLKRFLQSKHIESHFCDSAIELMSLHQSNRQGVILMDAQLPDAELTELLPKLQESSARPPIIAIMSLDPIDEATLQYCNAHSVCILKKPLRSEDLQQWLDTQRSTESGRVKTDTDPVKQSAAPATQSERTPADFSDALEGMGHDTELFTELAERFLESSSELVDEIESLYAQKDFQQLSSTAHKLKGSVGIFQQGALFNMVTRIEEEARDESLDDNALMHGLRTEFVMLREDLQNYLSKA